MHGARLTTIVLLLLTITPSTLLLNKTSGSIHPNPGLNISISSLQRWDSDSSTNFLPAVVQRLDGTVQVFWEFINLIGGKPSNPTINTRTTTSPSYVYNASAWSSPQVLVSTPLSQNIAPAVAQARNGTLYLSFASNRTGNFDIFLKRWSPGPGWYPEQQVTLNTSFAEKISAPVAASDGSLWLFYDRALSSTSSAIYYKVLRNGVWSTVTPLVNDGSTVMDVQPDAWQTIDGTIWVVYSRDDTVSNTIQIYYKTYRNGVWSNAVQLTTTTNADQHPEIFQDQNNTIWLAWNRELQVSSSVFQNDIFYTYSIDNGVSFVPETNLTNDVGCSSPCPEDIQPSLAQLKDGRVYLFWASNRDPQMSWNIYYATTSAQPFHNVAVTKLSPVPAKIHTNAVIMLNVTVANLGTFTESFFLFLTATNTSTTNIAAQFLSLAPGQVMSLSVNWNVSSVKPAHYLISANIPPIANEMVTGDNTMSAGTMWILWPADLNQDGIVNILDLAIVAVAFNSTPGSPNWNPIADLNHDGVINILDLAIVASQFGRTS